VHDWQRELIDLLERRDVLRFGRFTLKSGRESSYFVNLGLVGDGESLSALAGFFARKISEDLGSASFDVLFGPAYKGIPMAAAIAIALAERFGVNKPFAFNRKEAKGHGEGGMFVGSPMTPGQRALMIDDVLTDGATKIETIELLRRQAKVDVVGVLVGVDRMEPAEGGTTQSDLFTRTTGIPVHALLTKSDMEEACGHPL